MIARRMGCGAGNASKAYIYDYGAKVMDLTYRIGKPAAIVEESDHLYLYRVYSGTGTWCGVRATPTIDFTKYKKFCVLLQLTDYTDYSYSTYRCGDLAITTVNSLTNWWEAAVAWQKPVKTTDLQTVEFDLTQLSITEGFVGVVRDDCNTLNIYQMWLE